MLVKEAETPVKEAELLVKEAETLTKEAETSVNEAKTPIRGKTLFHGVKTPTNLTPSKRQGNNELLNAPKKQTKSEKLATRTE